MSQSLISIIIPTYNRGELLEAALRSVLAQTYTCWQLIVIDDGSVDDTRERVTRFCQTHEVDIEYQYQTNRGQAAARNAGLRRCRGEFVASLDSDDEWHPDFLAASLAQLQKHDLDFVFLNWTGTYDAEGSAPFFAQPAERRAYCTQPDGEWWLLSANQLRQLATETCPSPSSALVMRRTAIVAGWNEQMRIADDWCLLLDMVLSRPCRAAFTLVPHWLKNVHDTNIYDGRFDLKLIRNLGLHDERLMAQRFRQQLQPLEKRRFRQRLAMHYFNYLCLNRVNNPDWISTLSHAVRALYLAPVLTVQAFLSRGRVLLQKPSAGAQNPVLAGS